LGTRAAVAGFATGGGALDVGTVPAASLVDVTPELLPGASQEVRFEVPADQLGLLGGFGVHPLTVEIRTDPPVGLRRTAGTARTMLVTPGDPAIDGAAANPVLPIAYTWPLVGVPDRSVDGVLSADGAAELSQALTPGGRLGGLLAAGMGRPVTWVVDPALLEDVRSLATGRGLASGVSPDPVAEEWLAQLAQERGRAGTQVTVLPYADPDLVAVDRAGLASDLPVARATGLAAAATLLGGPVTEAPAWPGGGQANRSTLRTLQDQAVTAVMLTSSSLVATDLTSTPPAVTVLPEFPDLPALQIDQALTGLVSAGPVELGGTIAARQRVLAETAMIAAERPSDPVGVVVAPPRRWPVTSEWAGVVASISAPWLSRVTLASLREQTSQPGEAVSSGYPASARRAEVRRAQLAVVRQSREALAGFAPVVADPAAFLAGYDPALLSAQSTAWRGKGRRPGRAYTEDVASAVNETVSSVRLLERGQVTLSSGSGVIPLAVQNALDQDVQVRVSLTSSPSVRLRSQPTAIITVPAESTTSVDVAAQATTNATFPVKATLRTGGGAPFGDPVTFTVRATGYGRVAQIVIGGALILLAVAVVVRVARQIRAGRATPGGTLEP
jgi:Family of unknown function (DUF6049)